MGSKKKLTALGAYIFAGGFTLGVREHFRVLAHLEDGMFGVETSRQNLKLPVHTIPEQWPVKKLAGRVDFLYANPPCAPWSNAGSRMGRPHWSQDPLSACWRKVADLAFQLQPQVAAVESVRPLYTKGREMLAEIAIEARRHRYQPIALLEDTLDCNCPQRRPRFMLILTKLEYRPSPTRGVDVFPRSVLTQYRKQLHRVPAPNQRRATQDLSRTIEGRLLPHVPPGGRLCKFFTRVFPEAKIVDGKLKGRPSMLKYRVHPDEPSPTQPGGAILFHPVQDRYLTIGEAAMLSGYPPDYEFVGSISSAYAQIGKAVLPPAGGHVAKDAAATIHGGQRVKSLAAQEIVIKRDEVITKEIDL